MFSGERLTSLPEHQHKSRMYVPLELWIMLPMNFDMFHSCHREDLERNIMRGSGFMTTDGNDPRQYSNVWYIQQLIIYSKIALSELVLFNAEEDIHELKHVYL